jgi:ribosomal protein L12E/L44/L45/RPP1/RPP2
MPYSLKVEGSDKNQLVVSLAALLLHDSGVEISAENLETAVKSSNNEIPAYYAALYSTMIAKSGGVDKFLVGPSAGGAVAAAPAGGAAPAAGAAPAKEEKPKVEEVDALDGGMDMFGGSGGGGDY